MRARLRQAEVICRGCPVIDACLREAVARGDVGYRGGVLLVRGDQSAALSPPQRATGDLRPCGTYAAWRRHRRYGEPTDAACAAARAQYVTAHRRQRRRSVP